MSGRPFQIAALAVLVVAGVVLLFPAAVVYKRLVADGHPVRPLVEILLFVAVVLVGIAHARRKGDVA